MSTASIVIIEIQFHYKKKRISDPKLWSIINLDITVPHLWSKFNSIIVTKIISYPKN